MNDAAATQWRSTLAWLAVVAAGVAAAVALALIATRARIEHNTAARELDVLATLLPAGSYDNQPAEDHIEVTDAALLGSAGPLPVYRARMAGQPVAAILTVVARQGYVGPIRLLVSIGVDGQVLGVRVVAHQETPGLGDRIDATKSGWIDGFTGRSLGDPAAGRWALRRDGGEFDAITGATVTSRAVVDAVRDAVEYFATHRAAIFGRPLE